MGNISEVYFVNFVGNLSANSLIQNVKYSAWKARKSQETEVLANVPNIPNITKYIKI